MLLQLYKALGKSYGKIIFLKREKARFPQETIQIEYLCSRACLDWMNASWHLSKWRLNFLLDKLWNVVFLSFNNENTVCLDINRILPLQKRPKNKLTTTNKTDKINWNWVLPTYSFTRFRRVNIKFTDGTYELGNFLRCPLFLCFLLYLTPTLDATFYSNK